MSQWNKDNRFSGWVDNPLFKDGILQAKEIADKLLSVDIRAVYTSPLIRNKGTVLKIFEHIDNKYPIFKHLSAGKLKKI